jgi:phage anti-repressor protein
VRFLFKDNLLYQIIKTMNQIIIQPQNLDINTLINTTGKLSTSFQSKMITKLSNFFTQEELNTFIIQLFAYLQHHPTQDYPINLEKIFALIGFAHKKNAKRTLENNFTKDEDYKEVLLHREQNSKGGRPEEEIWLNVDTFKNMCMMAKTDKGKQIRKYYIKLENIFNDIINEEKLEYESKQKELENKNKEQILLLEQKDSLLENTKKELEKTKKLKLKKWNKQEPGDAIYGYKSNKDDLKSFITIGKTKNIKNREGNYFTHNQSGEMFYMKRCYNCDLSEKVIHHILDKYRCESNKEWFNISEKLTEYIIDMVCTFLDKFIDCSEKLPEFEVKEFLNNLLDNKEKTNKKKEKINKSSKYIGVTHYVSRQNWHVSKTINKKKINLGYYESELDAGKAYNDYIMYLNNTFDKKYKLNKIENYVPTPRNIPEETKEILKNKKTSEFIGVCYDKTKNCYKVNIQFNKNLVHLGCDESEIECAKIYNQQALYYNNTYDTTYKLNNIDNYKTIGKDIYTENQEIISKKKSSSYIGVNLCKNGKYRSYVNYDNKQNWLGEYELEIDAAKAYNNYVLYLNNEKDENYILNNIKDYITIPKNIPELLKNKKQEKKITQYTGVSYNNSKKLYYSQIYFNNRRYPLGYNKDEIECGKLYNQQALFFNEQFGTTYDLNVIENYETIAKNVNEDYENNKPIKSSKYYGVNKLPDGRYIALLIFNKKQLKLGRFVNEIEAAKVYNKKAIELNKNEDKKYKINLNI